MKNIEWFKKEIAPNLIGFTLKYVNGEGDFGWLEGVQFDSQQYGGYIYFWSLGFVGIQLSNYEMDVEIIEDSLLELECDEELIKIELKKIINYIAPTLGNLSDHNK